MWWAWTRTWSNRLVTALLISAATYGGAVLLDWDPQPVPFAVFMAVLLMLTWLMYDILDDQPVQWTPALPTVSDRVDEATSDLRILTSHQQASVPSEAVRDRLVSLARARDPDLAADLRRELTTVRRLSPAEIDRILTRIEDVRDRD